MQGEQLSNAPLLYTSRPQEVQSVIQSLTVRAQTHLEKSMTTYGYLGNNDYFYGTKRSFTSSDLLNILLSQKNTLDVLDIGGGTGKFLLSFCQSLPPGRAIRPHILSLHNLRWTGIKDLDYKVGNAEVLATSKLFPESSMDLLYSHMTEPYFVDSLGTLQQLYRLLKKDGILLFDTLHAEGVQDRLPDLIAYWQTCGNKVLPFYNYKYANGILYPFALEALLIQRTQGNLSMPVKYNSDTSIITNGAMFPEKSVYEAKYLLENIIPKAVFPLPDEIYAVRDVMSRINKVSGSRLAIGTLFSEIPYFLDRTEEFSTYCKSTIISLRRTMPAQRMLLDELDLSLEHALQAFWKKYASSNTIRNQVIEFLT